MRVKCQELAKTLSNIHSDDITHNMKLQLGVNKPHETSMRASPHLTLQI
jgi:hypothetical protein